MAFGDYPAEYNPKVHGPYDPARFYGKGKFNSMLIENCHFLPKFRRHYITVVIKDFKFYHLSHFIDCYHFN